MDDPWIEHRARIPFVGIIAIVVIVAVVAIFIKSHESIFPTGTIKVNDTASGAIVGHASSSFQGLREVPLQMKQYLKGTVSSPQDTTSYTIDYPAQLLTITQGGKSEQVILQSNGDTLSADFEYHNTPMHVDIDAAGRTLVYSKPGVSAVPVTIALGDLTTWQGTFTFKNQQYTFQFTPSTATISADQSYTIPLTQQDSKFTGTWDDGKTQRPVTVDTAKSIATIENVY